MISLVSLDNAAAIDAATHQAAKLLPLTNSSAAFFFADGISFGSQFGVAQSQLPATLLVDPDNIEGFKVDALYLVSYSVAMSCH